MDDNHQVQESRSFYRSMPDIRMMNGFRRQSLDALTSAVKCVRHMSLLDLGCLELVDFGKIKKKSLGRRKQLNLVASCGGKQGDCVDAEKPVVKTVSQSGSSVNFSSLSRFSKLKSYVNDLSEKILNVISSSFNLRRSKCDTVGSGLGSIGEETIGSYDVIEIEDIMETPGEGGRTVVKS